MYMIELDVDRLEVEEKEFEHEFKVDSNQSYIQYYVQYRHPVFGTLTSTSDTIELSFKDIRTRIDFLKNNNSNENNNARMQ